MATAKTKGRFPFIGGKIKKKDKKDMSKGGRVKAMAGGMKTHNKNYKKK
jgi:hypothetical protein